MVEFTRRDVAVRGVAAATLTASLWGCGGNKSEEGNAVEAPNPGAAEHKNYPPDFLPLDVPLTSPNKSLAGQDPYVDQLGRGFDSVFDDTKMYFVTGETIRSPINPTEGDARNSLDYELVEGQKSYYAFTKKSARAKGRYKLFSGESRGKKTSEKTSNSYSLHICALARRFDESHQYKNGTVRLTDEGERVYKRYKDRPEDLMRALGDSYIAGVVPGSELFINIRFETSSRSARENCSASLKAKYGELASGKASFSQVIASAQSFKKVVVQIIGLDGTDIPKENTADEAHRIIQAFMRNTDGAAKIAYMNYRPAIELTRNGRLLDFVNYEDFSRREKFVAEAERHFEYLDQAEADANYVIANTKEFDGPTLDRARKDLVDVGRARNIIFDIGSVAYRKFLNTGKTGPEFDPKAFDAAVPVLQTYEQLEPAKPAPAPAPRPRPEPRSRCNGNCRDGGGR